MFFLKAVATCPLNFPLRSLSDMFKLPNSSLTVFSKWCTEGPRASVESNFFCAHESTFFYEYCRQTLWECTALVNNGHCASTQCEQTRRLYGNRQGTTKRPKEHPPTVKWLWTYPRRQVAGPRRQVAGKWQIQDTIPYHPTVVPERRWRGHI